MHLLVIVAIVIYLALVLTPGQQLAIELAFIFLILVPLSILLWRVGAFGMVLGISFEIHSAIGTILIIIWQSTYGSFFG